MQHRKLGRYELLRVLGKGAMGVVYEGRDPNLDRHVAIKTIMVDDLTPEAAVEYEHRFRTEARSAARLHHANIVTVYDSDRDGDTAFLVMEYIQGEDLKHHLDHGAQFSPQEALHIVCDLLAALDFAHAQGVVHRDVKPANLLMEPGGRLKLTDFGVARITGDKTRTQGTMVGTLKYMAPEQVQGLRVDSRADLFSAGVVAYQLFSGARPFDGDNDFSIIHQIIGHTPELPSVLRPELPQALDEVILRGMAKDREQRYQTAAEFSNALQAAFGATFTAVAPALASARALPAAVSSTAPTMPGGAIGQELELEYWRAVRDSTDAHELQGFLSRFPQGIYADLARRRLQRLAEVAPDEDRTALQGATRAPASAAPATSGLDPTLAMLARPSAPPLGPAPASPQAPADAPTPIAASAQQAAAQEPSVAGGQRKVPGWGVLAGITAVAALAAGATLMLSGRGKEPAAPSAATPAAAPAAAASSSSPPAPSPQAAAASAPPAQASASPPVVAAAASQPVGAQKPASASAAQRRRENAPPGKPSPAPQPDVAAAPEVRPAPPPPPAVAPSPAPPPAPAAVAQRVPSPQEACKDKVFVAKDLCMHFECQKPELEKTPFCTRLKAEARAREEAAERAQRTR